MNRYKVNISIEISAKTPKSAYKIIKEIIESGEAVTEKGTFISVRLGDYNPKTVEKLIF